MNLSFSAHYLKLLRPFMPKQDIRYHLNGINVRPCEGGGVLLAACDGHTLAIARDYEGTTPGDVIIRCDAPAALLKPMHTVTTTGPGTRIVVTDKLKQEIYVQPGGSFIDGKYPNVIGLFPPVDQLQPGLPDSYQLEYLDRALSVSPQRYRGVRFFHSSIAGSKSADFSPVFVRYSDLPDFVVVVMPLADKSPALPDWLTAAQAKPSTRAEQPAAQAA